MKLEMKLVDQESRPSRSNPTDAGLDLRTYEHAVLQKGVRTLVRTGTHFKIPPGFMGLLVPRSSLSKNWITMTNSVGIIDSDYRGEVMASLQYNGPSDRYIIPKGERVVQLVVVPIVIPELMEVSDTNWNDTVRGTGGFGSTGRG